jgi:hypothetical protein
MHKRNGALTILLAAGAALGQTGVSWVAHHDGGAHFDDYAYHSAIDASGNIYVTGGQTNESGVVQMLTVKFDTNGVKQWARVAPAPGGGPDYGFAIAVAPNGNVIVAGDSVGVGTDYDLVTLAYTPDGVLAWSQRYDGPASGYDGTSSGRSLAVDASGDVFAGGYSVGAGTGYDAVVVKYSAAGVQQWVARYDGGTNGTDDCYGLGADEAGGVYVIGEATRPVTGRDLLTMRYDAAGTLLWARTYDGGTNGSDFSNTMAVHPAGGVVITGVSPGADTDDDAVTISYDAAGNELWAQRYDGAAHRDDYAIGVAVSAQGAVAVTGSSEDRWDRHAMTWLYDVAGNLLWTRSHDISDAYLGEDTGIDVRFDPSGNVWAAGFGWGGFEVGYDAYAIQYAPDGSVLYEHHRDGVVHGDDTAWHLVVHADGTVHAAGFSQRGGRHLDVMVVKYGPPSPLAPALISVDATPVVPGVAAAQRIGEPRTESPRRRVAQRFTPALR